LEFRKQYREDRDRLTALIQQSTSMLAQHRAEGNRLATGFPAELKRRKQRIEFGVRNLERQKEAARQALADREEIDRTLEEMEGAVRDRMKAYVSVR
jgi:hypothetical protein